MGRFGDTRGASSKARPKFTRDWIIIGLFILAFACIAGRLFYLQVVQSAELSAAADQTHTVTVDVIAERGTIYDRNGEILASSIAATTIYCDPAEVDDPSTLAKILKKHLGDEYDKSYKDYYSLVTTADARFVYIQRQCDTTIAEELKADLTEQGVAGIHYLEDTKRIYPNGDAGAQVIGVVDVDGNGLTGLELKYDDLVGGTNGVKEVERGSDDIPMADGMETVVEEAENGSDIICSIDIKLQEKAESLIKKTVKKYSAKGGSVTVMDAASGEIYAACSYSKTEDEDGAVTYTQDAGKLWQVSDAYEPGSTFKVFTAASVLKNSKVTTKTSFTVPGALEVYDATITDSHEHGTEEMSLRQIIAESSNIGTVLASRKTTTAKLYKTYAKFGFGKDPGVDFEGVSSGLLEGSDAWDGVQAANVTFGQGLSVTGMQLVRAYGAIEQRGTMYTPHFLTSVPNDSEKDGEYAQPLKESAKKKAVSESVADDVTSMMCSVVTSGTGTAAEIEQFKVAGKTGTAEVVDEYGNYKSDAYIVSFCGWLEDSSSDLVCLVTVDEPQTSEGGGPVCGPVFADIMQFAIERYTITPNSE